MYWAGQPEVERFGVKLTETPDLLMCMRALRARNPISKLPDQVRSVGAMEQSEVVLFSCAKVLR